MTPDPKLESLVAEQLRRLPPVPAPRSLVPRVLTAIETRRARAWWHRAWWDWPPLAQAAFILLALAIVALASTGGPMLSDGVDSYSQRVTPHLAPLSMLWERLSNFAGSLLPLWAKFGQPHLIYLVAIVAGSYLACVSFGTMLVRLAWQRK